MAPSIETAVHDAISSGKANGAIVCATNSAGTFTYNQAFGSRFLLSGEKVRQQIDDVLYLASATKLIASIAAVQCIENGTLSLTGDLSSLAPELAAKKVLTGFSDDGEPILEDQVRPITPEMLLTHTSGLAYEFLNPQLMKWRKKSPREETTEPRPVEKSFDGPLVFQPGEGWMYGPGLDWAGRIVERATGKTLGEICQQRIFDPLGINSAEFYPVTREDLKARQVDLNPEDPDGTGKAVMGGDGAHQKTCKGHFGGHGMFIAGDDFLKVLKSLLANDGKLLKPETVDDMFKSHITPEAAASQVEAMGGPIGQAFRLGMPLGTKAGYSLCGLVTQQDLEGYWGEGTVSWGGGMTFSWFIDRKNDMAALGAVCAKLPLDHKVGASMAQVVRQDIYEKRRAQT